MIKDSINEVLIPKVENILFNLNEKILEWSNIVILSMTHGQPASPTYLGKELLVFYSRAEKQINKLKNIKYTTKFGGAVGNFNAHFYAFSHVNWFEFADDFTSKLGLERNIYTTQIDNYDNYTEVFDILKRINTIFVDFCQDMWLYISRNILKQKIVNKEVGSSTMPHKVNPINFENAEGNLLLSNSLLEFFSRKLPISRMQRDLTDSTILRNVGTAFSYSLIAYQSILEGMAKIDVNRQVIKKELEDNFVVVAEGIQTKMKLNNIEDSYETIKEITRSNNNIKEELLNFMKDNEEYINLDPNNYAGKYILTQKI
jgi:adenylosuccinate lyase